jgi:DNA-binding transcriptional LysR family regulator
MSHLVYLRSFLSVYRHNSISRAAETLHLTQPAVSRHIKVLESRLDCVLFERLPRGLASTPAANELERQVGSHLDALEAVVGVAGAKNEAVAGIVRVGATSGFTKLLLSGLAPLSRHGIRLELSAAPPPALVASLAAHDLDLALTPARIPHKAIDYDLLHEAPLKLVCAPRWRERLSRSGAPKGLPLIELSGPIPSLANLWRAAFGSNPDIPSAIVADYQAALDAAAAGLGLAAVPECLCRTLLQTGQLVCNEVKSAPRVSLFIARNKGSKAMARIDIVQQLLADAARAW